MAAVLALLSAARAETALDALKQIPAAQSARIARIEGRDGSPDPERWYIITQDPAADNGVREFVVSNGKLLASRSISQFAESLKPEAMLGDVPVVIDSDKAAKLAHDYADANGLTVATINYDLKIDATGTPAWTISCLDDKGNKLGGLVVAAANGDVVSHDGFVAEPAAASSPAPGSSPVRIADRRVPHFETYAKPDVAANITPGDESDTRPGHHHLPPKKPESPIGKTIDKVGDTLKKFLPF
jgi:hypothetical protein